MNKKEMFEKLKTIGVDDLINSTEDIGDIIYEITDHNNELYNRFVMYCYDSFGDIDDIVDDLLLEEPKYGIQHSNGNYLNSFESKELKKIFANYEESINDAQVKLKHDLFDFVEKIVKEDTAKAWDSLLERIKEDYIDE